MATSTSWAQDVITCDLCDKPTHQFCNNCQVNLCETCVKKHRDEFKSLMHEIVPFLERKIQLVFPECKEHSGQRCEVNCKQCNTPVCVKCIVSGPHKGHDVEELIETHEKKIQKIKSDTEEIRAKIIPKYENEDQKIGNIISTTKSKIDDLRKESKELRKLWHQEVDNIFDKIDSLSQSLGEENLIAQQRYHHKKKGNSKELNIEIGDYRAILKQMSQPSLSTDVSHWTPGIVMFVDKVRVIATIPTTYSFSWGIACIGEAEAWIYGENETITRIDIHGAVRDTVTTSCLFRPGDISVTKGKELMYSNSDNRTVNIIRDWKTETLITTPQGWTPRGLCCTRSGDILVHVYTKSGPQTKNKIISYQGENIKQEISNDGQGNPIFKYGNNLLFMSENNNGDVCVSDVYANTVVVVDQTGRVRFRYDGTPDRREKYFAPSGISSFRPTGIVTDALSQIIVADINNNCLHILDQNGQFLRCVDSGLLYPLGLSVDSEGRLWVGSEKSEEIKVIEYLQNK
uniref:Tripartite motif-containing protein 2-like n=1 Tax=Crassostrea virginica TaxID=6565 RepID=A0A8B8C726_CRAVI|nr:tripartite motif-containing protein 2-like [Crassostrea virginica]